jgi:hypothetical protein
MQGSLAPNAMFRTPGGLMFETASGVGFPVHTRGHGVKQILKPGAAGESSVRAGRAELIFSGGKTFSRKLG